MTKTDSYVALLGDVIDSRGLAPPQRARLQTELRASLAGFNRRWRAHLVGKFAVTRGDEFECLLAESMVVWDVAHAIRAQFLEVDWIIACGRGTLTTPPPRNKTPPAPELDGPCFHAARAALDAAKAERRVFAFSGFGDTVDSLAAYYSALYWSWTTRQRRVACGLRFWDYDEALQRLGVHPTAVSHMKRRLAWPLVAAGDTMFQAALREAS